MIHLTIWGDKRGGDVKMAVTPPNPVLLGWPKISFRFFCIILWKNAKELFDQLDTCRGKVTEDEKFNDAIGVNNYYIFLDFCE